jgi:hypothetical protein
VKVGLVFLIIARFGFYAGLFAGMIVICESRKRKRMLSPEA